MNVNKSFNRHQWPKHKLSKHTPGNNEEQNE